MSFSWTRMVREVKACPDLKGSICQVFDLGLSEVENPGVRLLAPNPVFAVQEELWTVEEMPIDVAVTTTSAKSSCLLIKSCARCIMPDEPYLSCSRVTKTACTNLLGMISQCGAAFYCVSRRRDREQRDRFRVCLTLDATTNSTPLCGRAISQKLESH
jgi:hypothetical protein